MNDNDRRTTDGRPIIHRGLPAGREFALQTILVGTIIPVVLLIKAALILRDGFVRYEHEASAQNGGDRLVTDSLAAPCAGTRFGNAKSASSCPIL